MNSFSTVLCWCSNGVGIIEWVGLTSTNKHIERLRTSHSRNCDINPVIIDSWLWSDDNKRKGGSRGLSRRLEYSCRTISFTFSCTRLKCHLPHSQVKTPVLDGHINKSCPLPTEVTVITWLFCVEFLFYLFFFFQAYTPKSRGNDENLPQTGHHTKRFKLLTSIDKATILKCDSRCVLLENAKVGNTTIYKKKCALLLCINPDWR